MYQFVVAVLVPLQTLVARICGVASENLVLPPIDFCLNVRPSVSMHTSRRIEMWFVDCSVIMSADTDTLFTVHNV